MSNSAPSVRREKLEVPSAAAFERRFLVDGGRPSSKPDISVPAPPTDLLSRLQNFLPAMQSANQQLQQTKQPEIDNTSDEEGPYVELDLACGLFDLKDQAALAAAERSLTQHGVAVEQFGGASSSDDDLSDENDEGGEDGSSQGVLLQPQTDAALPMETDGAGAAVGAASGGREGSSSRQQLHAGATGAQGKRRAKAKHRKRRAGIEVLS